jgi:hypothetical protein
LSTIFYRHFLAVNRILIKEHTHKSFAAANRRPKPAPTKAKQFKPPAGYYPCFSKIIITVDDSKRRLNIDQFELEKDYIANQFVTREWTDFERISLVSINWNAQYWFGSTDSYDSFRMHVNDLNMTAASNQTLEQFVIELYMLKIVIYFQQSVVHSIQ